MRLDGWALGQPRVLLRDGDHLSRLDALGQPRWSVDLPPGSAPGVLVSADERYLVAFDATRSHVVALPGGVVVGTVEGSVTALSADKQADFAKTLVNLIEKEGAGYDLGAYRDAPPGLRIWCGATVEAKDVQVLTQWLDWAFAEANFA